MSAQFTRREQQAAYLDAQSPANDSDTMQLTWQNGRIESPGLVTFDLPTLENRFVIEIWNKDLIHTGRIFWDYTVLGTSIALGGDPQYYRVRAARAHELANAALWP